MTREEAIQVLANFYVSTKNPKANHFREAVYIAIQALKNEPKHRRWIEHHEPFSWMGYTTWTCSECDYEVGYEKDIKNITNFCPKCGSDNREVKE